MGLISGIVNVNDVWFNTSLREWGAIYGALKYFVDNAKDGDPDADVIKKMLADQSAGMLQSDENVEPGKIALANEIERIAGDYADGDLAMCEIAYVIKHILKRPTSSFMPYLKNAKEKSGN